MSGTPDDTAFDLRSTQQAGVTVVRCAGEIDMVAQPALAGLLEAAGAAPVVVDLTPCTFIDSSGVAALLVQARRAGRGGTPMAVVCPEANEAWLVLGMVGFTKLAPVVGALDEALAVVGGGST